MKPRLPASLLFLCICAGAGTSCFNPPPSAPPAAPLSSERSFSQGLPVPTKDEVALVDGRALSISGFFALRTQLKRPSTEGVLWVGIAALALQNETRARGHEISTRAAVDIARYALGDSSAAESENGLREYFSFSAVPPAPTQVKQELDRIVSKTTVQRNERAVASLNQS
jgi:hypothetical protein